LKEFNCNDLETSDLKGESDEKKENGELDISMQDAFSDEVTGWMAGQDKKGSSNTPAATKDKIRFKFVPILFCHPHQQW